MYDTLKREKLTGLGTLAAITGGFVGAGKDCPCDTGGFVGTGADLFTVLWGGFVGAMTGEGVGA